MNKLLANAFFYAGLLWIFGVLAADNLGYRDDVAALGRPVLLGGLLAAALGLVVGYRWWATEEELDRYRRDDDVVDALAEKMGHLADAIKGLLDALDTRDDVVIRVEALEAKCRQHRLGRSCPAQPPFAEPVGPQGLAPVGVQAGYQLPGGGPGPQGGRLRDPDCVDFDLPARPSVHDQPTDELKKSPLDPGTPEGLALLSAAMGS